MIYNLSYAFSAKICGRSPASQFPIGKNVYIPDCRPCRMKDQCGGSPVRLGYSKHIIPFEKVAMA